MSDAPASNPSETRQPETERPRTGPKDMLKILGIFVVVGLFGVGGVFALQAWRDEPPPQATAHISAKLELAAGEVELLGTEDGAAPRRLLSGTPLPAGAKLRTAVGARALIRLSDGSRVFMRDETEIQLALDEPHAGITLRAGELWLETPPLDREREPLVHTVGPAQIVLTDGGASMRLREGEASVYVAEGIAAVSSESGRSEVHSGERARVPADGGAPVVAPETFWDDWTGGMADRRAGARIGGGSGSLYAVDDAAPPGTPALPLSIAQQIVDVAIEDGLAETRVDQRFFNPSDRDVEGWYWFTVPEGAMLVGFELETDGQLIKGEIVERRQAAATYASAKVSNDHPALLEWIDARTVRAKIFPVPAMGERRIVVRYQQLLSETDGKLHYSYPLSGPGAGQAPTIEEFALAVELRGELHEHYAISTLGEATVSSDNRLISMRRSGFTPRADFELELSRKDDDSKGPNAPLRLSEYQAGADQARFIMLRWLPDIDFEALPTPRADVVVVVDTSAFGDDAEHQSRLAVAEALLRSLSSEDRFAVIAADLNADVLYPAEGLEQATTASIDAALEALDSHRHGGATDLGGIFERALSRVHDADQPAIVYIGDGLATSGERSSDALAERLRRALTGSRARLFTVGVGPAVDQRLLARLARVGGGESLRVDGPEQAVVRALELSGAIKTPTLTDLAVLDDRGVALDTLLDDSFSNATGKLARGRELVILARTHGEIPETIDIRFRVGGVLETRSYTPKRGRSVVDFAIPKLWSRARIERLLGDGRGPAAARGKVLALGLEYGLMTPFTSFLALDSERAYSRKGIERRDRPWDRQLLGRALPHSWTLDEHGRAPGYVDPRPGVGELLLGALAAPIGCDATDQSSDNEDRSASARSKQDEKSNEGVAPTSAQTPHDESQPDEDLIAQLDGAIEEEKEGSEAPAAKTGMRSKSRRASSFGRGGLPGGTEKREEEAPEFFDDIAEDQPADPAPEPESGVEMEVLGGGGKKGSSRGIGAISNIGTLSEKDPAPPSLDANRKRAGGDDTKTKDERFQWRSAGRPSTISPVARNQKAPCSDASSRPLAQRKILWAQQLERAPDMVGRLRVYELAAASCELKTWRQQRVLLHMLQATVQTEAELELLIAHFWDDAEARAFMVRALQRRLVDKGLIAALERALFGGIDLDAFERAVVAAPTDDEALRLVEDALIQHRAMPAAERLRLDLIHLDLLFTLGRIEEAIRAGRKLRELGLMTPALAERLGELLVESGQPDEAKRVYSEIVEYDPSSPDTRRLLGDIFMRHQWYQEAYRQYGDLVALSDLAVDRIRLARAAAGAGRIDEGLRILRQVAIGEGRPGVDDPRRWARLHAAVSLGRLLASDDGSLPRDKLTRELKRLQLFDTATTWTFVVWTDLGHSLTMGPPAAAGSEGLPDKAQREAAEAATMLTRGSFIAGDTGLWAVQHAGLDVLEVRHQGSIPPRPVAYERIELRWTGETFEVSHTKGEVAAAKPRPKTAPTPEPSDVPE